MKNIYMVFAILQVYTKSCIIACIIIMALLEVYHLPMKAIDVTDLSKASLPVRFITTLS